MPDIYQVSGNYKDIHTRHQAVLPSLYEEELAVSKKQIAQDTPRAAMLLDGRDDARRCRSFWMGAESVYYTQGDLDGSVFARSMISSIKVHYMTGILNPKLSTEFMEPENFGEISFAYIDEHGMPSGVCLKYIASLNEWMISIVHNTVANDPQDRQVHLFSHHAGETSFLDKGQKITPDFEQALQSAIGAANVSALMLSLFESNNQLNIARAKQLESQIKPHGDMAAYNELSPQGTVQVRSLVAWDLLTKDERLLETISLNDMSLIAAMVDSELSRSNKHFQDDQSCEKQQKVIDAMIDAISRSYYTGSTTPIQSLTAVIQRAASEAIQAHTEQSLAWVTEFMSLDLTADNITRFLKKVPMQNQNVDFEAFSKALFAANVNSGQYHIDVFNYRLAYVCSATKHLNNSTIKNKVASLSRVGSTVSDNFQGAKRYVETDVIKTAEYQQKIAPAAKLADLLSARVRSIFYAKTPGELALRFVQLGELLEGNNISPYDARLALISTFKFESLSVMQASGIACLQEEVNNQSQDDNEPKTNIRNALQVFASLVNLQPQSKPERALQAEYSDILNDCIVPNTPLRREIESTLSQLRQTAQAWDNQKDIAEVNRYVSNELKASDQVFSQHDTNKKTFLSERMRKASALKKALPLRWDEELKTFVRQLERCFINLFSNKAKEPLKKCSTHARTGTMFRFFAEQKRQIEDEQQRPVEALSTEILFDSCS